ncbi:MAG: hypothetical protein ACI9DJ_003416 [Algoriphagus sp.]|jgi:hypothetical protein
MNVKIIKSVVDFPLLSNEAKTKSLRISPKAHLLHI